MVMSQITPCPVCFVVNGQHAFGCPDDRGIYREPIGLGGDSKIPSCSFCKKSQREVKFLIESPGVHICDECIGLCNEILASKGSVVEPTAKHLAIGSRVEVMVTIGGVRSPRVGRVVALDQVAVNIGGAEPMAVPPSEVKSLEDAQ